MQALHIPLNHTPDFLAEIVARSKHGSSRRTLMAERLVWLKIIGDALVIVVAANLAFWLHFGFLPLTGHADPGVWHDYTKYISFGSLSLLAAIATLGAYDRHLLLHLEESAWLVGKAWAFWLCGGLIIAALLDFQPSLSRGILVCYGGCAGLGLLTWRLAFHRLCRHEKFASALRERVLLISWNADAERLADTMRGSRSKSYELLGWLPSPKDSSTPASGHVTCLGKYEELVNILRYSLIDIVIFTDREARREEIIDVASVCEREMVQFQLVPSYFQILLTGLHLQHFNGMPLLGVSKLPLNRLENRILKRAIDLIGGAVGLVLTAPLIALFATLVYLESPGSIFYHQRRLGRKGLPFDIIKIRSMRLDAEKDGKVGWSTQVDSRRLKIGSFMRKYNIDELPQFWNVLKGELSLVGPRPERPELIAGFKHEIANYNTRHTVKPGLTGWAQVHGWRGDTDLNERIRHDLYYMENWNLILDLQIMVLTLFKHKNAC